METNPRVTQQDYPGGLVRVYRDGQLVYSGLEAIDREAHSRMLAKAANKEVIDELYYGPSDHPLTTDN